MLYLQFVSLHNYSCAVLLYVPHLVIILIFFVEITTDGLGNQSTGESMACNCAFVLVLAENFLPSLVANNLRPKERENWNCPIDIGEHSHNCNCQIIQPKRI